MRRPRRALPSRLVTASPASVGKATAIQIDRELTKVSDAVNEALAPDPTQDVDLVTGTNRLNHGLGRKPTNVVITPRDPDPAFAWGYDPAQQTNPHPDRQCWIEVVGGPMRARVVFL